MYHGYIFTEDSLHYVGRFYIENSDLTTTTKNFCWVFTSGSQILLYFH